jgi:hypothetical protein
MTMKKANEVAVAYTQKYDRFLKKEKQLLQLVRGTFLEQEMRELGDRRWRADAIASALPGRP